MAVINPDEISSIIKENIESYESKQKYQMSAAY